MYIATKVLLTFLSTFSSPDLCDVVHERTGEPTICSPHAEGAPVYDAEVCCQGSSCVAATGECATPQKRFYCELGEINAAGLVSCYWEVPHYCDVYECDDQLEIDILPQNAKLCCPDGQPCTILVPEQGNCLPEDIFICDNVVSNGDGTVDCVDGE